MGVKQNGDKVGQGGSVGKQKWDVQFFWNFSHFFMEIGRHKIEA